MSESYEIAVPSQCILGEGPHYDPRTNRLLWVDIFNERVHIFDLKTKQTSEIHVGKYPSLVIPTPEDPQKAYVAIEDGVFIVDLQTGSKSLFCRPETRSGYRYNDGKLDPRGRLWVGSMDISEEKADGKLWMINPDGSFEERLNNIAIPNGLDWTATQMFYIDSPSKCVKKYEYDINSGLISNPQVLLDIVADSGVPDGMTLSPDRKFALVAHWGGYGIYIYEVESGRFLRKVHLPAAHTTSCTWIHDDLYVTSAKKGRSAEQLATEPHAGDVFVIRGLLKTL